MINFTKRIDTVDQETMNSIVSFPDLVRYPFGFEMYYDGEGVHKKIIAPSFFNPCNEFDEPLSFLQDDAMVFYEVNFSKAAMFPIQTNDAESLWNSFSFLHEGNDKNLVQFLFKKRPPRAQRELLDQYRVYLDGVDLPGDTALQRKSQKHLFRVINWFNEMEQEVHVEAIEKKIADDTHWFCMRVACKEGYETLLKEALNQWCFYNSFSLSRNDVVGNFMRERKLSISPKNVVSSNELYGLFVNSSASKEVATTTDVNHYPKGLPVMEQTERKLDEAVIADIQQALYKARVTKYSDVHLEVLESTTGPTVDQLVFRLPDDVIYTDVIRKTEDIQTIIGKEISMERGKFPNSISVLMPAQERDTVYLGNIIQQQSFQEFSNQHELPFSCGIDMENEPIYKCLTKAPHLLVAGATNSGKNVFINSMLATLLFYKDNLTLYLVDTKKVEFSMYKNIPNVKRIITDMEKAAALLEELVNEMEHRYDLFSEAEASVRTIASYNKKSKTKTKMPYIICVVDEYNDLRLMFPEVESSIERLGQKARSAGIHLILATQRPDKNVLSGVIKTNLPSRVSFQLSSNNEYKTVFGTGIPYRNLLGVGDGVVKYVGQNKEFIRFQAPILSLNEEEEENVFKQLSDGTTSANTFQVAGHTEELPIDKMKRIINESGETRTKELQQKMNIRMNDVVELRKTLVDQGFLKKEGRRYSITR